MKLKTILFLLFFLGMIQVHADLPSYLYDEAGVPSFVKVYLKKRGSQRGNDEQSLMINKLIKASYGPFMQEDLVGAYIAVPLHKRCKNADDEDYWICPHCGRKNPATQHYCSTRGCPFGGGIFR